ncbi:helix-turn-helix domain-containing protein [Paenibacillus sp. GCM10027626]|uniref:helix-turn-helix domain-containing protein n=1 Tax=Paenibacillus sp. GCM10027626 TaxID=3273411 RepID=UPI00362CD948
MEQTARWVFEDESFIPEVVTFGYDDLREALLLTEHHHAGCFEFVYMEKGRTVWEVDDRTFETKSGEVFTAFPDEVHKGNYDIIEPCRFWWIIVRVPPDEERQVPAADKQSRWLRLARDEEQSILEGLRNLPRVVSLGPGANPLFRRIQAAAQRQGELDRLEGTMALLEFLLMLVRCSDQPDKANATMPRVAEIIAQLPVRLGSSLSIPELAEEAGLGTTHFYRLFQEMTGLTPKAYIEHLRIEEASRRLLYTDESITSLAMDLGFTTSQHFATVFRRIKGRTPTQWRRQSGKAP